MTSAFALAHLVNRVVGQNPMWMGAFAGAMAVPLSSTLLAVIAVRLLGRRMRLSGAGRLVGRVLVVGLLNASLGVTAYEVVMHSPWGWPLVVLVCLGVLALYFAYSGLLREQRDLEALADVSLMVARSGQHAARPAIGVDPSASLPPSKDWQVIAERIKDQVGARRVVLRLWPDPRQEMHTVVAGDPLPERRVDAKTVRDDPMLRLAGTGVRQFRLADASTEVLDALASARSTRRSWCRCGPPTRCSACWRRTTGCPAGAASAGPTCRWSAPWPATWPPPWTTAG